MGVKIIQNPKELPNSSLKAILVRNKEEAEQKASEYSSTWFYQSKTISKISYLYILASEYDAKHQKVKV